MGLPDHLTCLLRKLYAGQQATVRTRHGTTDWFKIWKGYVKALISSPCLFNLYAEYIVQNARLDEAQSGINIAFRNINNIRYADDTTLMTESEEDLKSISLQVKEESQKAGLKLYIQKVRSWCLTPSVQFSSVQSFSHVRLFVTPWTTAHQASLSITNSWSPLKPMSIESVMPSNHLILCHPLLLLPSIFPRIRSFQTSQLFTSGGQSIGVSASKSVLPMNTQDWSPLGWTGGISLQSKGLSRVFSNTTVQKHQFFGTQLSSQSNSHIHTWPQEKP